MFQLHRNHIGLPWPVKETALSERPVEILVDVGPYEMEDEKTVFKKLSSFHGHVYESLKALENVFVSETGETNGT